MATRRLRRRMSFTCCDYAHQELNSTSTLDRIGETFPELLKEIHVLKSTLDQTLIENQKIANDFFNSSGLEPTDFSDGIAEIQEYHKALMEIILLPWRHMSRNFNFRMDVRVYGKLYQQEYHEAENLTYIIISEHHSWIKAERTLVNKRVVATDEVLKTVMEILFGIKPENRDEEFLDFDENGWDQDTMVYFPEFVNRSLNVKISTDFNFLLNSNSLLLGDYWHDHLLNHLFFVPPQDLEDLLQQRPLTKSVIEYYEKNLVSLVEAEIKNTKEKITIGPETTDVLGAKTTSASIADNTTGGFPHETKEAANTANPDSKAATCPATHGPSYLGYVIAMFFGGVLTFAVQKLVEFVVKKRVTGYSAVHRDAQVFYVNSCDENSVCSVSVK
ncbi:hypothetical protein L596_000110 [Steinernema carpocapsae]|uniref:Uncharacterized protein n=1 Tax=Steinernema carpocapsae TaxID=34508 RepID=A0A4V6I6W7_STECR|nr:hypothetical protein L596_000110 [Steinernema carpocapsae]